MRHFASTLGVVITIAALGVATPASVFGQSKAGSSKKEPPRTPWGTPNLEGLWTGSTITPLERPAQYKDKAVLTPEEAKALETRAKERASTEPAVTAGEPGTYNQVWFDPSSAIVPDRRTSLVVDPPDGRIPYTPAGKELATKSEEHYGIGARDTHMDFDTGERCLTDGMPIPYWSGYNNNYQLVQTKDFLLIASEMYHDVRIIPLDGRPLTGAPQWLGESRGHWEGDTLVVETSNFLDKKHYWWASAFRAARPGLKVTERFRRTDDSNIEYEFTMEDPNMFTRPWTARFPLTTDQASRGVTQGRMYEYACHEGNYSIVNAMRGGGNVDGEPRRRGSRQ